MGPLPRLADVHACRGAVRLAEGATHAAGEAIGTGTGQGPGRCRRVSPWGSRDGDGSMVMAVVVTYGA